MRCSTSEWSEPHHCLAGLNSATHHSTWTFDCRYWYSAFTIKKLTEVTGLLGTSVQPMGV